MKCKLFKFSFFLSILCLFISCETHVIEYSFDSDSYNSNLEQWKQSDLKNYQFEFTTDYRDSGIYYVGVVTVVDGVSYVKFPESYNSPFRKTENYPSYFKNINTSTLGIVCHSINSSNC